MGVRKLGVVGEVAPGTDELIDSAGIALRVSGARKCKVCMDDEIYAMIRAVQDRCIERGIEPRWDALHSTFRAMRPSYAQRGPATAKSLRIHVDTHTPELRALAVARQ